MGEFEKEQETGFIAKRIKKIKICNKWEMFVINSVENKFNTSFSIEL